MAKRISQATFDAAVAENVEEFEMEPTEALADAIEQFKSQGVDLSNIVTEVGESKEEHPVLAPLNALRAAAEEESEDNTAMVEQLRALAANIGDNKEHKTIAASNGALELLAGIAAAASEPPLLVAVLGAVRSVVSKHAENRKLASTDLVETVANVIVALPAPDVLPAALRLGAVLSFRLEDNKRIMYKKGAVAAAVQLLGKADTDTAVMQACMGLVRNVITNDDRDAPMSKCFDTARELHEEGLSTAVLAAARANASNAAVVADAMSMLRAVCVNNTICTDVVEEGKALDLVASAMTDMKENAKVAAAGAALLRTLAGNDDNKKLIGHPDSPTLKVLLQAVQTHSDKAKVVEHCCGAFGALTLRCPENAVTLVDNGAHVLLARAMVAHAGSAAVCRQACLAVRNIVSRSPELKDKVLGQGVQKLLEAIKERHRSATDYAKAALRDLGCDRLPDAEDESKE